MEQEKKILLKDKNLLFCDIETTGLDMNICKIVEIAATLIKPDYLNHEYTVLDTYYHKVRMSFIDYVEPEVREMLFFKRISENYDRWNNENATTTSYDATYYFVKELRDTTDKPIFVGSNPKFDIAYLDKFCPTSNPDIKFSNVIYYKPLDIGSLAWPFVATGEVESNSLSKLASYFKINTDFSHTAKGDVDITIRLFKILMERLISP